MGWSIGFDQKWNRDIGYGVPCVCDHPGCDKEIDRGLSYVCCGDQPEGGEHGCGLYFCPDHKRSHYTDNHANAALSDLVESLMLTHEYVDEAIESVMNDYPLMCERCARGAMPFDPSPDIKKWIDWKETDPSWAKWRAERDAKAKLKIKEA